MMEVVLDPTTLSRAHSDSGISTQSSTTSSEAERGTGIGVNSVTHSRADLVTSSTDDDDLGGDCGWLCLKPKCLQCCRSPKWLLFWLCWASAVQGMVVNGFVNSVITNIEKRFDLRSTDTGVIAGAYDIASVLCSIPVSYLGSRVGSSKPRWLGMGMLFMGLGSFVFSLPHFLAPSYDPSGGDVSFTNVLTCLRGVNRERCVVLTENWMSRFRYIFVLGQFLHGVGASPLYTLGITFLDESVPLKMSSMYLGIFYAMAVVGPAIGFVLGSQFLQIYIDSPAVNPDSLGLNPESDLWLGGWWIGFILSGVLSILIAWPIMAFPGKLPGMKAMQSDRVSEAHSGNDDNGGSGSFGKLTDMPNATKTLLANPTFVALSLAGATEGILMAGFATFMPKFMENQFQVPAASASALVGLVAVPAGGGGTLVGGWLLKKLRLRCAGILKMCVVFSFVCFISCFTFMISCPNPLFAGVSVSYDNISVVPSVRNLTSVCNSDCGCADVPYDPVCGSNNIMYFSPCHAGCNSTGFHNGMKKFTGCSCIAQTPGISDGMDNISIGGSSHFGSDTALRHTCPNACNLMTVFMLIFFVIMLITFIISLPALTGTLRCVPDDHRSFALGLQWIVVRLLGTIPGPILFGALIDNTCTLWQETCGKSGSCRSYDNFSMSRYMMGISLIGKALSTILFFMAYWLYIPPPNNPSDLSMSANTTTTSTLSIVEDKESRNNSGSRKGASCGIDNPAIDIII
ncbi:unnamed protein product, partial [Meganyctiphanes norvegica]